MGKLIEFTIVLILLAGFTLLIMKIVQEYKKINKKRK